MNSGQRSNSYTQQARDSVSAAFIMGLIRVARSMNLVLNETLDKLDFNTQELEDPLCRVPYSKLTLLLDSLNNQTCYQRDLGVEIGCRLMPGNFSALGYAAASCRTLGEAINLIPNYEKVALTSGRTELSVAGECAQLSWTTEHNDHSFLLEDIILSTWVQLAKSLVARQSLVIKLMFTGPVPEKTDKFTDLFGDDIMFDQSCACVLFPSSLMNIPITHSDVFINKLMKEQAAHIHQSLDTDNSLVHSVTEDISRMLVTGEFSQDAISKQHCLSVRTLRRRLKDEGTSYQSILDNVRREKSKEYLNNTSLSIYEVAMQLGYSEHSAFSAAFKRWYGVSPQSFREIDA